MHWSNVKPAFLRHPKTGEDIWFNQVTIHHHTYYNSLPMFKSIELPPHKYPCTVYYGDGSTIEPEVIQHLRAVSWSCAVGFRWRKGDLLVLDNLTVQHGRIGFTGKREILVHLMTDWTSVLTRCFISSLDHEKNSQCFDFESFSLSIVKVTFNI